MEMQKLIEGNDITKKIRAIEEILETKYDPESNTPFYLLKEVSCNPHIFNEDEINSIKSMYELAQFSIAFLMKARIKIIREEYLEQFKKL